MSRDDESLVTIATFGTSFEASLARGALEAAGIEALVPGEEAGTFSLYSSQPRPAVLQVLESNKDRAIAELRRLKMHIVEPPQE